MNSEAYLKSVTIGEPAAPNGIIELLDYDPRWPELYLREETRIRAALGRAALRLEHVGSTSVPGLCANPILDILLLVQNSAAEADYQPQLEAAGYTLRVREPDWFEHRMFRGISPSVHLHVFSEGCAEAKRMLAFRDHLRRDAADRALYAETKRRLAQVQWRYVQNYADAETQVVQKILARALNSEPPS